MGKPGNTAKLKDKIFCKFGIFPRQSCVPAGTKFFRVNKNIQLVENHLINQSQNLRIQISLTTKCFHRNFLRQTPCFYLWNRYLAKDPRNSHDQSRNLITNKSEFYPRRSFVSQQVFSIGSTTFISVSENKKDFVKDKCQQSSWIFVSRKENQFYFSNSMDQLLILINEAPFGSENIAKIPAFEPNTPTTRSAHFGNETIKIASRSGDFSIPTQGQHPDFSSDPASMFEAANNSRVLIREQSSWETKELVYGTLVQEFLPFLAAKELLLQMQSRDELKGGIVTKSMLLNATIHLYRSLEEQEHMSSKIRPRNQHPLPTILLTGKNSNNIIRRQLTEFLLIPASNSEAANHSEGLEKAKSSWGTKVLDFGSLFRAFLIFNPVKAWVRHTYINCRLREGACNPASFLEAADYSEGRSRVQIKWVLNGFLRGNLFRESLLYFPAKESYIFRAHFQGRLRGRFFANLSTSKLWFHAVAIKKQKWLSFSVDPPDRCRPVS